jgi:single-stranded-DNA-specific exonuclease
LEVVEQIQMLAPFGTGNPRPVLFCGGVELDEPARRMGTGDRHLSVKVRQGSKVVRGVAFSAGDWCDELNAVDGPIEIAYRPVINDFRGYRRVEIHLVDWRPASTLAPV